MYVQYLLSRSEGKWRQNIETSTGLKQVTTMGHFIIIKLLNPTASLEAPYPYASNWVELDASIPKNLFHLSLSLALVALHPCLTYWTSVESHLLTCGGDYSAEILTYQKIDDISATAWAPYCTVSLFVQPRSGVPFRWDRLFWDNLCQELCEHQCHAAKTDGCPHLHHGEKEMSLCRYTWSGIRAHYCHLTSRVTVWCLFPSWTKGLLFHQ
jgi:hypothetical protein